MTDSLEQRESFIRNLYVKRKLRFRRKPDSYGDQASEVRGKAMSLCEAMVSANATKGFETNALSLLARLKAMENLVGEEGGLLEKLAAMSEFGFLTIYYYYFTIYAFHISY